MQSTRSEAVRTGLVEAIEGRYYSPAAGGQMWLHDLSTYVQALPSEDARLVRLAGEASPRSAVDYLELDARPEVSRFDPSDWLDSFTLWALQDVPHAG